MSNTAGFAKSPKWHTTFYYEQELRSYYMNQILSGLVKPGIYNATFSLVTVPTSANIDDSISTGLHLYIKKGSTFIFSNSYKQVTRKFAEVTNGVFEETKEWSTLERNFEYPGNVVIKCVAEEDMLLGLAKLSQNAGLGKLQKIVFGSNSEELNLKEDFYIMAKFIYNPKENSDYTSPVFEIHTLNRDYITNNFNVNSGDTNQQVLKINDAYFFLPADNDTVGDDEYPIPDGTNNYNGGGLELAENVFYLTLGLVKSSSPVPYCSTSTWISVDQSTPSHQTYIKYALEHSFISRGLPEYSNNQLWDQSHQEPHIITDPEGTGAWLNLPYTQSDDVVVKAEGDWKEVHKVGNYRTKAFKDSLSPNDENNLYELKDCMSTIGTLQIADFTVSEEIQQEVTSLWKSIKGIPEDSNEIPNNTIPEVNELIGFSGDSIRRRYGAYFMYDMAESPVVCDIVFLKLYKNISNYSESIFSSDNTQEDKENHLTNTLQTLLEDARELTRDDFLHYQWVSKSPCGKEFFKDLEHDTNSTEYTISTVNFDPHFDKEHDRFRPKDLIANTEEGVVLGARDNPITHKGFSSVSSYLNNMFIIPQDKCQANIDRLLPLITNNNFIPRVIDVIRQKEILKAREEKEGTPAKQCTALVPLLVGFRKMYPYKKDANINDFETNVGWKSFDGISDYTRIHPANILSFFDLQNSTLNINSFKIKSDNTFNVLSVID